MKAKYTSLMNLISDFGWDVVGTNEYSDIRKDHLLDLRKEKFVFYMGPNKNHKHGNMDFFKKFRKQRIEGSDWNSYFYGATFKGLIYIKNNCPEMRDKCSRMIKEVFDDIFDGNFYKNDWGIR